VNNKYMPIIVVQF